ANPGTIITRGSSVTIWCQGSLEAKTYHLYKERVSHYWNESAPLNSKDKVSFSIEYMDIRYVGQFWCAYHSWRGWSEWSDSLLLVMTGNRGESSYPPSLDPMDFKVTGVYRRPTISAQPGPPVLSGDSLTLQCQNGMWPQGKGNLTDYTLRCYGSSRSSPHMWSHPSDPLDLKVTAKGGGDWMAPCTLWPLSLTGTYEKPSLSAHPGPSVTSGESVTLQCCSDDSFDTFHLFKEGFTAPPQRLHWQNNTGTFQANFTMSSMTSAHGGTYRCYSSHSSSPYLLSQSSDPLELVVSGEEPLTLSPRCSDGQFRALSPGELHAEVAGRGLRGMEKTG
ncbi:leukocyte immunoglobulin-like receptor subfamily A member 6, partial [Trichechus inunguis]